MLDLDETLVHASALPMPRYDFSFSFPFGGVTHTMYVRKRPFLEAFFNHLAAVPRLVGRWSSSGKASAAARTSHRATPPRHGWPQATAQESVRHYSWPPRPPWTHAGPEGGA